MPGKNKTPLLGWHPPAELSAWVRAEAERRGLPLARILDEALTLYRRHIFDTAWDAMTPAQRQAWLHDDTVEA